MALQGVNLGVSKVRGLGQKPMPRASFLCGKEGRFKWECPKTQTTAPRPCPICWGDHWKRHCPWRRRSLGLTPQAQDQDWWDISIMAPVLITTQEPWVTLNVGIQSHFSVLLSNPGPLPHESATFIFLACRLQNSLHNLWVVTGNPFSFLNTFLIVSESNFSFRNS